MSVLKEEQKKILRGIWPVETNVVRMTAAILKQYLREHHVPEDLTASWADSKAQEIYEKSFTPEGLFRRIESETAWFLDSCTADKEDKDVHVYE